MHETVNIRMLDSERAKILRGAKLRWPHWAVVAASLILTIGAWYISSHQIDEKNVYQFERTATQAVELVLERMQKYEDGLWGGVAAIQAEGGDITHANWRTFADSLRIDLKYPGINGIGVIHFVPPDRLDTYLREQRKFRPDYKIHPPHQKAEYWPISYIEPVAVNAKAVGLDMAHETNRHTAGMKARDTGTAQITGPITLVQDSGKTPGFLFYAPFYQGGPKQDVDARRASFTGMVYAPFVFHKLMEGTLDQENRLVSLSVRDGDVDLFNEFSEPGAGIDPNPMFTKAVSINLYGRTWDFKIASNNAFRQATDNSQPLLILFGGILIDTMLFAIFVMLTRANQRAVAFADAASRSATEKEERTRAILETAVDGIISVGQDGAIDTFNAAAERIFGYKLTEVAGLGISELFLPEQGHIVRQILSEHGGRGGAYAPGINHELIGRRKDRSEFPVEMAANKMIVNGRLMFTCNVRDITDRKQAELMKSEFVSTVSHELRTPLTSINGALKLIKHGVLDKQADAKASMLDIAINNCERLATLVNDILDMEKIEAGKLEYKMNKLDLNDVVEASISANKSYADQFGSYIEACETVSGAEIRADRNRVLQVLDNLLSNAVKFSPAGSTVKVTLTDIGEAYRIAVQDFGSGIPVKFRNDIFSKFSQADSSDTRAQKGTGLGLSISKAIVEQHGGVIGFDTESGKGSTFFVELPKSYAPAIAV